MGKDKSSLEDLIEKAGGCAVVDGGFATQLERHGAVINDPLWSALCLIKDPHLIKQVALSVCNRHPSFKKIIIIKNWNFNEFVVVEMCIGPLGILGSWCWYLGHFILPGLYFFSSFIHRTTFSIFFFFFREDSFIWLIFVYHFVPVS